MQNRKIAVIDDDKKFLGEIGEVLSMGGYAPIVVHDSLVVVETVVDRQPDVILIELRMPKKNGFELTDAINRIFETMRMPIIAMSASFKDEFHWLLDFCGIKTWLKKPFQPLDVIWAIENVLQEASPWDEKRLLLPAKIAQEENAVL